MTYDLSKLFFDRLSDAAAIYEAVDDGEDFIFRDFNATAERIEGISRNVLIGNRITEMFPGVREFGLLDVLKRVWKTGTPESHPLTLYSDDKLIGWRENYVERIEGSGNLLVFYNDKTDLRGLLDSLFGFVGIYTTDGLLVDANEAPLIAAGLTRHDVIGKPFWDTYWWNYSKEAQSTVRDALQRAAKGESVRGEFEVRVGPNKIIIVDAIFAPLRDEDGSYRRLFGFGVDISRQKEAEQALSESMAQYRDATRIAKLGHWVYDEVEDKILHCSEELARIHGLTPDDYKNAITSTEFDIRRVHPKDQGKYGTTLRQAQKTGGSFDVEYRIITPTGEVRYIREIGEPVLDDQGKLVQSRGTLQDITDQKRIEQQLKEAQVRAETASRTKTEFLANMSHELRTPLNSIMGFSQVMSEGTLGEIGNPKYLEYCRDILNSAEHLLDVINDILDVSKVEAGEIQVEDSQEEVGSLIDTALSLVKGRFRKEDQNLSLDLAADLPMLRCDARLTRQILVNLLSNAMKFTPDKGDVTVRAFTSDAGGIVFQVTDTGIGIAPEHIETVLTPFGQVRSSHQLTHAGTGLGLPLSKRLMEIQDGTLRLESTPGQGTTVTITFPPDRTVGGAD